MNLLAVLRDAWFFYSRNLVTIVRLCLPLILIESVAHQLVVKFTGVAAHPLRDLLVTLLFYPLYTGALIFLLDARSQGFAPSNGRLLAMALLRWPAFALLAGLTASAVLLGLSLFVIPGLWLMVKLAFSEILLVQRNLAPLQAMRASFALTEGRSLPVLGCVVLTVLPLWALNLSISASLDTASDPLAALLVDGVLGLAQLFSTVVFFRLYMLVAASPDSQPSE